MSVVGFNVARGTMRWVALSGTVKAPVFEARGSLPHDCDLPVMERMCILKSQFGAVLSGPELSGDRPTRVAYRLYMGRGLTQEQIGVFHYPWGILNILCSNAGIPCEEILGASLTSKRLGLPKGIVPMKEVDHVLGTHPPSWDDHQRYAALAAWAALG